MKRTEPFDFYQPTTLAEASRLLKDNGPGGRFLAGGTDLVIAMKEKGLLPKYIVDLKRVPGLSGIRENGDGTMTIGALTTMYAIETSPVIKKKYPFLAQSAAEVGSIQIRNRATIGGNMANATPSADVAPSLIALNATAKIASAAGERTVSMEEFFRGPGQNVMSTDEILTEITIPKTGPQMVGEYIKFSPRDMMDLAYIGVAVAYNFASDKKCSGVRIVLGAVAPTPVRAKQFRSVARRPSLERRASRESRRRSDARKQADQRRALVRGLPPRHGRRHDQARVAQRRRRSSEVLGRPAR